MSTQPTRPESDRAAQSALPFLAPCRPLRATAPLRWVSRGWADFLHAPRASLGYGIVIVILSWLVTGIGLRFGSYWAALVLLSGFVFIAPDRWCMCSSR